MAIAVNGVVYPSGSAAPLTLRVHEDAAQPLTVSVTVEFAGESAVTVYSSGSFADGYSSTSSVSGTGTSASPYVFSVKPTAGWPGRPVRVQVDAETTAPVLPPTGWETREIYRQYASEIDGADQLLSSLAANPSVRTSLYWSTKDIGCLVQDTTASRLAEYDTCRTKAAALSPAMNIFPGLRANAGSGMGMPTGTATEWCKTGYWQTLADKWALLLSRRNSGDPRILIDAEAYGGDEFNRSSLTSAGKTISDFRTAFAPLADALLAASPVPVVVVHPQVLGDTNSINLVIERLIEVLGEERVLVQWENAFSLPEQYRTDPWGNYLVTLSGIQTARAKFDAHMGVAVHHVQGLDDDAQQRVWGAAWRAVKADVGPLYWWEFDRNRADKTAWGTAAGYNGTTLNSLNDVDFAWAWPRTFRDAQVGSVTSGGLGTATSATLQRLTASGVSAGYSPGANLKGLSLDAPGGVFIAGCLRAEGVLPTGTNDPFTVDGSFILPSTAAVDFPLFGQVQYNSGGWQVYYEVSTGKIWLQTKKTSTTYDRWDTGVTASLGQHVRIQIGKSTNTWLYTGSNITTATNAAINDTDIGYAVAALATGLLVLGAGSTPANFPLDNQQFGMAGLILPSRQQPSGSIDDCQTHVWKTRKLSSSDITTKLRGAFWPFGWGT